MSAVVAQALSLWGMDGAEHVLFAARENIVHRVKHGEMTFALRLHRAGYRSDAELVSELCMMAAAGQAGLAVPKPIASLSGDFVHVVDDVQVDMLGWLGGAPMARTDDEDEPALFEALGREMARLHIAWDDWVPPEGFTRCAWDHDGLVGGAPIWGRFWENPTLDAADRALFTRLRDVAGADLAGRGKSLDYGLIHADLVGENIMLNGDSVQLIDFDDAGYGYRLFEIATALLKNIEKPQYEDLKVALLAGYGGVRPLDTTAFELFLTLRSATYVGWITTRLTEDGAVARNDKFVRITRQLAQRYLESSSAHP